MSKTEILTELGKNIRKIREAQGITQKQLAHKVAKDQQSIQRLEAGRMNPSVVYLLEIAAGLGVEAGKLLGGLALTDQAEIS